MRMRLVKIDGNNAVAYTLGENLVIATGDSVVSKAGTHKDLAKLDATLKGDDLKTRGFKAVK